MKWTDVIKPTAILAATERQPYQHKRPLSFTVKKTSTWRLWLALSLILGAGCKIESKRVPGSEFKSRSFENTWQFKIECVGFVEYGPALETAISAISNSDYAHKLNKAVCEHPEDVLIVACPILTAESPVVVGQTRVFPRLESFDVEVPGMESPYLLLEFVNESIGTTVTIRGVTYADRQLTLSAVVEHTTVSHEESSEVQGPRRQKALRQLVAQKTFSVSLQSPCFIVQCKAEANHLDKVQEGKLTMLFRCLSASYVQPTSLIDRTSIELPEVTR